MLIADCGESFFAPIPGDPAAIRQAAATIGRLSARVGAHGTSVAHGAADLAGSGWSGSAADRFAGVARGLAGAHTDIEACLGSLPGPLNSYADALESAQQDLARAGQMMRTAEQDCASATAALTPPPAHAGPAVLADHQSALNSITDRYDAETGAARRLAGRAAADHHAAAARLTAHLTRVADESKKTESALIRIGDGLGVPTAVVTALTTVAFARAAERLATVGPAFTRASVQESDHLIQVLSHALATGDMTPTEIVGRLSQYASNEGLAAQIFTHDAQADAAGGGLRVLGRAAPWVARGAGGLAVLGDAYTIWRPDEGGAWGNVERGVAAANGVATVGMLAVDGAVGWVPVAGQVVIVATGVYLLGNYLYAHTKWFHDGIDAVGHGLATAGEAVGHGLATAGETVGHGLATAGEAVGHGLASAGEAVGHGLSSAAGDVAGFFGL